MDSITTALVLLLAVVVSGPLTRASPLPVPLPLVQIGIGVVIAMSADLPVMPSDTHIVPILVGDAELCKQASDRLLTRHGIYIQPINYPTVPRGTERLRVTPTPLHGDVLIDTLRDALVETFQAVGIPFATERRNLPQAPAQATPLLVSKAGG